MQGWLRCVGRAAWAVLRVSVQGLAALRGLRCVGCAACFRTGVLLCRAVPCQAAEGWEAAVLPGVLPRWAAGLCQWSQQQLPIQGRCSLGMSVLGMNCVCTEMWALIQAILLLACVLSEVSPTWSQSTSMTCRAQIRLLWQHHF